MKLRPVARNLLLATATAWLCQSAHAAAAHPALATAKQMMERHQADAAYKLLAPLAAQLSGDPDFDYLLGIAALDSGHTTEAIFALERVVDSQPDNQPARLELARAHFVLGEKDTAKQEFEAVKASNPPKEAVATINRYLNAIAGPDANRTQIRGFAQFSAGRDGNANSATDQNSIAIPFFGGISLTLGPDSREIPDNFFNATGGISIRHMVRPDLAISGTLSGTMRRYNTHDEFDQTQVDGQAGITWFKERSAFSVNLLAQQLDVNDDSFRRLTGVVGQWTYMLSEQSQIAVYGQTSRLTYPTQSLRDARRNLLGAAYAESYDDQQRQVLYTGVYGGSERPTHEGVSHLGNQFIGVRIGGTWPVAERWDGFLHASYERRKYGGTDPLFLVDRNDRQYDIRGGLSYRIQKGVTLSPQISYTRNRSNIVINDYKRPVYELLLRYDFE